VNENNPRVDDLSDVLAQFEQRLTRLHQTRRLPDEAPEAFRAFKEDVDRRLSSDRRATSRPGASDRRFPGRPATSL
jgi:hypothetical protein